MQMLIYFEVIFPGILIRRYFVFANIPAYNHSISLGSSFPVFPFCQSSFHYLHPIIIKTHSIDEGFICR